MDHMAHTASKHADFVQELREVPSQDNVQEFPRRVWASFQVPKARCHAPKVNNDYSAPLAPHYLDRDQFLPLQDM